MSGAADSRHLLAQCMSSADWSHSISDHHVNASYSAQKSRFTYLLPRSGNKLLSLLDLSKAVDVLLLTVSVAQGTGSPLIDDEVMSFLSAVKAAGMPEVIVCAQGLNTLTGKALFETKKKLQQSLDTAIVKDVRVIDVTDTFQLIRTLSNSTMREISWRSAIHTPSSCHYVLYV